MNRATLDEIPTQSLSVYTLRLAAPYFPFLPIFKIPSSPMARRFPLDQFFFFFFLDLLEADAWIEKLSAALDAAFPF